jgi:hypothetical protein
MKIASERDKVLSLETQCVTKLSAGRCSVFRELSQKWTAVTKKKSSLR